MERLRPIRVREEDSQEFEQLLSPIEENSQEFEQPLSPMARMFHEPDSNVYIVVIMGFKTPIDPDVIKANLVRTFLKHPRFRSLQVMDEKRSGELVWVKTEVNLDNHVKVPKIDTNVDSSPDKVVEDYISNLSKTTISKSMPMWDLHLLNVRTSEAESTAILRVHHSLGDGTSLMSLLLSCTRKVSDPEALPTIPTIKRRNTNKSSRGLWQFFLKLWLSVLLWWNTVVDVVMYLVTVFFLEDTKTPLKSTKSGTNRRRFVHATISLDDVKLVKNAMGATINDVMVGVTQAALSHYLNRKYGENKKNDQIQGSKGKNNLSKHILLRATFFVNIRPSSGIHSLDDMMRSDTKDRWGNHIGYILFPFTIGLREDPLDYVREAKIVGARKKATLEAKFSYFMSKFFLNFCGTKVGCFPTQTTLWFSNVPGPEEEVSYFGHPIAFIAPSCYGQPNALMIHVVSYVNKMKIILSADESIIPDPHQLCDDLQSCFKLIKDAVVAKGLVGNNKHHY